MRILIDAHLSENWLTGVGRYINELVKGLLTADRENEYIILVRDNLEPKHPLLQLDLPNLIRRKVNLYGLSLKQHYVIPDLIKYYQPDVYHHPQFYLPLGVHVPSIITVHDIIPFRHAEYFPKKAVFKRGYMRWMLQSALKRASKVIVISEATRQDIIDMFSAQSERIETVYHGISLNGHSVHLNSRDILKKYLVKKPYILFVGERRPHKNIPRLIEGFKKVTELAGDEIQLVIAGKARPDYKLPENIIKESNLESRILLLDFVEDDILKLLYKNAELFILPSLYEGFGMPLLEAMKFDLPVLGANISSMPEVIGDAGLLFDPLNTDDLAEKVVSVLQDYNLKQRLIEKGRKHIEKFTWEKAAVKTLRIYQQAFENSIRN